MNAKPGQGSPDPAADHAASLLRQAADLAAAAAEQCRSAMARWEQSCASRTPTVSGAATASVEPGQAADAGRAAELSSMLVEFAGALDQVVWNTWKAVSPNSALKRQAPLKACLAEFLSGSPDVSRDKVKQDLERLRQLTAALTASINQAGRQFAQRHLERFGAAEIERVVRDEGGGGWGGIEGKCWKKYQQVSQNLDADEIQRDLLAAIAAYTESLLRGIAR